MKRLWAEIGRTIFWMVWPLLWVYLRMSRRTRVVVSVGDEVLVVKGWLGDGNWDLPGGGRRGRESPEAGAVREVREETGIVLDAAKLRLLLTKNLRRNGHVFWCHGFGAKLTKKPPITRARFELTETAWRNIAELIQSPDTSADVKAVLAAWSKK